MTDINYNWPPPNPDVFGQILTAREVRQALLTTIEYWSTTYIAEVAAITGLSMAPFGSWEAIYDVRALPADETAACWVTCRTTNPKRPPQRQGTGIWWGHWLAEANIVAYGGNWDEAADLIAAYLGAVRTLVLQHKSLGGFATDTVWMGEATKEIEHTPRRTIETGVVQFDITVAGLSCEGFGPAEPLTAPGTQPGPTVETVSTTYEQSILVQS